MTSYATFLCSYKLFLLKLSSYINPIGNKSSFQVTIYDPFLNLQ